jgi:hypothetical protein
MSALTLTVRDWTFTVRSAHDLPEDARYAYLNASRCIACDTQVCMGQPVAIANMDFFKVPTHAPLAQIVEAIEGGASLMIWSAPVCPRCAPINEERLRAWATDIIALRHEAVHGRVSPRT